MTIQTAFYFTRDIMRLYDCSINQVPRLIERGVIPKPVKNRPGEAKRWLRVNINKKLGITDEELLRKMIREEVSTILNEFKN